MSTRSALGYIPVKGEEEWRAIYCHWDGYPSLRGKQIWEILHKDFLGNKGEFGVENSGDETNAIKAFCQIYIDGHKGGFSSFPKVCYCHNPEFVLRDGTRENVVFEKDLKDSWIEYLYLINPWEKTMQIYEVDGSKKELLADINLLGSEPNWEKIENPDEVKN